MSIFKSEKDVLIESMFEIIKRETGISDVASFVWFTDCQYTYIGHSENLVSSKEEIANLINAVNALNGNLNLINVNLEDFKLVEEDETVITCAICGENLNEGDVNIIDYDIDVCNNCEPEYKKSLNKGQ